MAHHRRYPQRLTSPHQKPRYLTRFYVDRETTSLRIRSLDVPGLNPTAIAIAVETIPAKETMLVCSLETERPLPKDVRLPISFGRLSTDGVNVFVREDGQVTTSFVIA